MEPHVEELDWQGVDYRPITCSAYGRPHEDTLRFIKNIARREAKREGTEVHLEERFIMHKITVGIWRRAARMVRRCFEVSADVVAGEDEQFKVSTADWRGARQDRPVSETRVAESGG